WGRACAAIRGSRTTTSAWRSSSGRSAVDQDVDRLRPTDSCSLPPPPRARGGAAQVRVAAPSPLCPCGRGRGRVRAHKSFHANAVLVFSTTGQKTDQWCRPVRFVLACGRNARQSMASKTRDGDRRTRRRRAVNDYRREIILAAARRVFAEQGLEGASMRAIATAAGYTPGALYFHFKSKEGGYGDPLRPSPGPPPPPPPAPPPT